MPEPKLRCLTVAQAETELHELESNVEGGIKDFEARAHLLDISSIEAGIWERISELRWLLGRS
ncbi:MAG: hypothetical protein Q4D85_07895 [Corynebacterium sp.]|uniref:hypothetical protein n=1 Tax=Corynebacterium sp. TaxID=1720 RepID=UPI0026DAFA5F|nr:hypothetical protein [Corynebacterium sp.]MDO5098667.1 hypothetical protein [Corynebacterium sp.]